MASREGAAALPDPVEVEELTRRLAHIGELSQKVWAESLARGQRQMGALAADPLEALPAMARLTEEYLRNPEKMAEAAVDYWTRQAKLWTHLLEKSLGREESEPPEFRGDRRFQSPEWVENPWFDWLKDSYLTTGHWLLDQLREAESLDPRERRKLTLLARNYIEALAPANFPATNPEVLKATVEEKGENLVRGLENLLRDLERGKGTLLVQQTDMEAFKVGENLATTPGKVVFQNEVMQLIQYAPATETVHDVPLLIVAPWINKFYILDLNEKRSMVRWLVERGHTVFMISWVNPDERQRNETWESYMRKGPLTAIEKVLEETGAAKVNVAGYCIGGTLLGTTLAWMAAKGDKRVAGATFLAAQFDFTDAGELQAFADEKVIEMLEAEAEERGYIAAEYMAQAFNSLRASDLIWSYVINNYLLGKENFPFDLLYWNADSTNMPPRVHLWYLRQFYVRNALARGEMEIDGVRLDLKQVTVPSYHVATVEDHIAPAPSVYRGARLFGGRSRRFVLAGSGHIAGVVNPPALGKYQYWTKPGLAERSLEEWRRQAKEFPGSWWPHWDEWLARRSRGRKVEAREPGRVLGAIEDAPGSYVRVRFDQR